MAEEDRTISYKEDKAKYVKQCHSTWEAHFEQFKDRIEENVQLANNYSQDLADRKADESLSRACLFIPLISPAVLARAAHMTNIGFSVDEPVEVVAKKITPPKNAESVRSLVHDYFEKDNFQQRVWLRMKLAQEQWPISFLQISEFEEEEKILNLKDEFEKVDGQDFPLGTFKHWENEKSEWRPTANVRTQESVFYEPEPAEWDDKIYVGTITPLTTGELVARKKTRGYTFDLETLKQKGKKVAENDFRDRLRTGIKRESKKRSSSKVVRWEVLEMFHIVEEEEKDEQGNLTGKVTVKAKITTSCGEVELLDRDFPYEKLRITDLLIPVIGYPVLNQVEGNTTCDQMKYLQHAVNDFFNITIDAAKYGLFPPRIRDSRCKILNRQIVGPGCEYELDMTGVPDKSVKDVVGQLFTMTPTSDKFFALINVLFERSEIAGGAPEDILQGTATNPDEKATKTRARIQGMSNRLQGLNLLSDAKIMSRVAYVFWAMTLERLPYGQRIDVRQGDQGIEMTIEDFNGQFHFAVPHLENMAEREIKVARLEKLMVSIGSMPFAQHPAMMPVMYTILKKMADLELITDFDEIFPPQVIMEIQAQMEAAAQAQALQGLLGGSEQKGVESESTV